MVRFRALRFVLLSIRQVSRPCVRLIVRRASGERPRTRQACVLLGRFSLALSAVMAEWTRREMAVQHGSRTAFLMQPLTHGSGEATSTKTSVLPEDDELRQFMRDALGHSAHTPEEKNGYTGTQYTSVVHPVQHVKGWYVFRRTFAAPFTEYQLVAAGADLLIELLVYLLLLSLLYIEMHQDAVLNIARERRANEIHGSLAAKLNEVIATLNRYLSTLHDSKHGYTEITSLPLQPPVQPQGAMVAFPALKFVLLGVRQFTRPVVRHIVQRAMNKRGLVYQQCIVLGRISLGLSSVMAEWSRNEMLKKAEVMSSVSAHLSADKPTTAATQSATQGTTSAQDAVHPKNKAQSATTSPPDIETKRLMNEAMAIAEGKDIPAAIHAASAATLASVTGTTLNITPSSTITSDSESSVGHGGGSEPSKVDIRPATTKGPTAAAAVVTPRSRLLMPNILDEPATSSETTNKAKESKSAANTTTTSTVSSNTQSAQKTSKEESGTSTLFVKSRRTGAAAAATAARLFLRNPYRSTWYVFHKTFFAPFPLPQLLNAGAELLIEVLVFVIFAVLLYGELQQQARNAARKEAYYNAKLDEAVAKVNELVRIIQERHPQADVSELQSWPKFISRGRWEALTEGARSGIGAAAALVRRAAGSGNTTSTTTLLSSHTVSSKEEGGREHHSVASGGGGGAVNEGAEVHVSDK